MIKLRKVSSLVTGVGLIALVSVFQNCDRNIDCDRAGLAQSLNQKNYDEIISQEAELLTKCPDDRGVQITIAHAYLGSAGFEMFNMASISLRATDLLISLKNLDSSVLSDPPAGKNADLGTSGGCSKNERSAACKSEHWHAEAGIALWECWIGL